MIDKTTVRRDIERHDHSSSRIDVEIEVESGDTETAKDIADRLAEAIHDELRALEDDNDE